MLNTTAHLASAVLTKKVTEFAEVSTTTMMFDTPAADMET